VVCVVGRVVIGGKAGEVAVEAATGKQVDRGKGSQEDSRTEVGKEQGRPEDSPGA
jgi:hypothetical protein